MSQEEAVAPASGPAVDRSATADSGAAPPQSPVQARLEDQIAWYDTRSEQNQLWFKVVKVCQIVVAAAIPVAAAVSVPAWLMGGEE